MAEFWPAWQLTKDHEGGYNHNDVGNEVYRGINRKYNPNWEGWKAIDAMNDVGTLPLYFTNNVLDTMAANYYKSIYWLPTLAQLLTDQATANVLFDQAVAGGVNRTNDFVKDILNKKYGGNFKLNGLPEVKAIDLVNSAGGFIKHFNRYRRKFFLFSAGHLSRLDPLYTLFYKYNRTGEEKKREKEVFLPTWMKRVNSYGDSGGDYTRFYVAGGVGLLLATALYYRRPQLN